MIYDNMKKGKFIERPNRFIAKVNIDSDIETVHVKNTGRCKELLTLNSVVFCQKANVKTRKTGYDLISVYKGDTLINMDSMAPNKVFGEALESGKFMPGITFIKPEKKYGDSRIDFYFEKENKKYFAEVKGVTLEENGVAMFPDAPTERGIKHINELIKAKEEGYEAFIVFVIAMKGVKHFTPNYKTHKDFGEALKIAKEKGVNIVAYDCIVTENSLEIDKKIKVIL
ncbi:MAG: DNA/RNA nuclease SfsA [Acutalibacteraceae bacterium]